MLMLKTKLRVAMVANKLMHLSGLRRLGGLRL